MKPKLLITGLAALLFAGPLAAQDASPTLIPFQGRLTDQNGQAQPNGQFTITFNLYDQAIGGTSVWTERHEKVSVINGTINAFLGAIGDISTVNFSTTKYLGITVDADDNPSTPEPEMVPRTMIIPAFFAKQSENTAKLNGSGWEAVLTESDANSPTATIKADRIGSGTITEVKLADGAVSSGKIANDAVGSDQISDDSVTSADLADGTITGDDILDASVTNDDLGAGTASANLADEGLIALGAYPLSVGTAINFQTSGTDVNWDTVITVPANSYAVISFFPGEASSGWVSKPEIRIGGQAITQSSALTNITVGPGIEIAIKPGYYAGQYINVYPPASICGVVIGNQTP